MYLHRDRETFRDMVEQASDSSGRTPAVVEKDYYVTLILKLLSEQLDQCVFKGGTSLSKGFHVIDRFSEDIDITFKEHIGESRRKKLKNVTLKGISEELGMPVANWEATQSDHRARMPICPSAEGTVDVPAVIMEFCDNAFYREDYRAITSYFAADAVPYDEAIGQMRALAAGNLFIR